MGMASRVLLIDDDARLAELLAGYLQPNGFALEHAGGGPRGLVALETSVLPTAASVHSGR